MELISADADGIEAAGSTWLAVLFVASEEVVGLVCAPLWVSEACGAVDCDVPSTLGDPDTVELVALEGALEPDGAPVEEWVQLTSRSMLAKSEPEALLRSDGGGAVCTVNLLSAKTASRARVR